MKNYMDEIAKHWMQIKGYVYKNDKDNYNSSSNLYIYFENIIDGQITQRFSNKYGPLDNTKLIYFLDDLNMPQLV